MESMQKPKLGLISCLRLTMSEKPLGKVYVIVDVQIKAREDLFAACPVSITLYTEQCYIEFFNELEKKTSLRAYSLLRFDIFFI